MFLQSISNVGYSDCSKIKRDIDHLNKNPFFQQFFKDLSSHLKNDCVVTNKQQARYEDLDRSKKLLQTDCLFEAVRCEEHQKQANLGKHQQLQRELKVTKQRLALLEQQLLCLDDTYTEAVAHEDDIQEVVKSSSSALDQSRGQQKSACIQCSKTINSMKNDCETAYSNYKSKQNAPPPLLSLVDLGAFLNCEDDYTSQLTHHAKKQFENIPQFGVELQGKLLSATDTILLGDGDKDEKSDLLDELNRATQGYANRKKRLVLAVAQMEKSVEVEKFLQHKINSFSYSIPGQDFSRLESLKYAVETTKEQSSYYIKSILPNLISKGAPMLKNLVLTGDFKRKLIEQRKIRGKQRMMIDLLLNQCSRLSLIWMMVVLEKTRTGILSKKMEGIANVMAKTVEAISGHAQMLNAVEQIDNSNKEPKAVIDKRDTTMLNLHKLLVSETSSSMFKTFESIREAALELMKTKHQHRNASNANVPLSNALRELFWNHTDASDDTGRVILCSSEICAGIKHLQDAVAKAKVSVPKVLTTIDKKRAFLEHNEEASRFRDLWMSFVNLALVK